MQAEAAAAAREWLRLARSLREALREGLGERALALLHQREAAFARMRDFVEGGALPAAIREDLRQAASLDVENIRIVEAELARVADELRSLQEARAAARRYQDANGLVRLARVDVRA